MNPAPALIAVAALLAAVQAHGQGADIIIKQRAKELSNQNNVRQGVAPPSQTPRPQAAPPKATPAPVQAPAPSVTKLQNDLAAIKANDPVTPALKQTLTDDIMAVALTTKPSRAAAAKLAEDLAAAFSTKPLSPTSRTRLVQELDAVLNPSKYPQAQMQLIFPDVQAIFQENNLDRKRAVALSEDVKALAVKP